MPTDASATPRPARRSRTREALLRAGRALFASRPVDAVSIDDIVQAADVAKGSFYNHFTDREDLVRTVTNEIRELLEVAATAANEGIEDPARRIARAVCVFVRFAVDEPERARVLVRIQFGGADPDHPRNRPLVEDLQAGLATGRLSINTLESGVLFVIGLSQAILVRVSVNPVLNNAIALAQQMCALMLRGLGVPAAEADAVAARAADEIVRRGGV